MQAHYQPRYIVGPLLVTNSVNWALWGILSTQLVFFLRDLRGRRRALLTSVNTAIEEGRFHNDQDFEKRPSAYQHNKSKFPFEFGFRRRNDNVRNSKSTFGNEDVNPWRKSFVPPPTPPLAVPSVNAYPTHARQRSGKSVPSSSDPCSPTAVHRSPLDAEAHSIFLQNDSTIDLPSVYLLLALYAMYVFICLRTVLGTAQFWRISVDLWGVGAPGLGHRWAGLVLADCIGPLIFAMTMAYFIYALYFSPMINATTAKRRSTLRPLSLLKNRTSANLHPDPYSFPFPHLQISTSNSHSLPPHPRTWRRFLTSNSVEPGLLVLLATVVTVCGFIDCVRERPLGEPLKLDAVSLIWFAGMVALDSVLCVLLVRALESWLRDVSWIARISRVMGEAGGMQLVVALLALILMVSWRDGKPRSTLQVVAPSILPAIYGITVFLHVSSAYSRLNAYARDSTTSSAPQTKSVVSKFENIEMDMRAASRRAGTITPAPPTRVDLAAAAVAGSTYSTTNDSSDGGAALRAQALAYGRERDRAREREREKEATGVRLHLERDMAGGSSTGHLLNPSSSNANVVGVSGVGTAGSTGIAETVTERAKAPSVRSGVSGALSLELPTFRKGRTRGWRYENGYGDPMLDEESGSDIGSDDWDEELDVDSTENGGTWDYGFANSEREKERERAAATLFAGATTSPGGGKGSEGTIINVLQVAGPSRRWQNFTQSNKRSSYPSRPSSWRRSYPHPLSNSINANGEGEGYEDDDKVSMLSGASTRSRRRGRRSYYANSSLGYGNSQKRPPRLLPRTPGTVPFQPPLPVSSIPQHVQNPASLPIPSAPSISSESLYLTGNGNNGLTSPAGSVLVIGRGREPSIAEQSVDRAASVAATRASTGSLWSTFSDRWPWENGYGGGYVGGFGQAYPRPVRLPDLDVDLAEGRGTYANTGSVPGIAGGHGIATGSGATGDGRVNGQDLGEVLALSGLSPGGGVGRNGTRSPHPYSAAGMSINAGVNAGIAEGEGEARGDGEERPAERRRWNVHPLKRIAEMGRLRF